MSLFYIYKITNKLNNKVYIGKTNNPEYRWKQHIYTSIHGNKKHGFSYVHHAIAKHGIENFSFDIIEICDNEKLSFDREKFWITEFSSNNRKIGYNLTIGGEGASGRIQSKEERLKRSNNLKGKYTGKKSKLYGKKLSKERKKKISESNKGKIMSEEAKAKISIANHGENNGMFNRPASIKTKKKQRKNKEKLSKINQVLFIIMNFYYHEVLELKMRFLRKFL